MNRFSSKNLAGPGYIILNTIRAMNIIVLVAVIAASIVMVVKTFTVSKFFFFDAVTHVITATSAVLLMLSECALFKAYFARVWPLLSDKHGFIFLGIMMLIIGNNTLGYLNKDATSADSIGLAWWRLVIGSGIVTLIMGFVNILVNFMFRSRKLGVTARQVRTKGAMAHNDAEAEIEYHEKQKEASILAASSIYSSPNHKATPVKSPVKAFFRNARDSWMPSLKNPMSNNKADQSPVEPGYHYSLGHGHGRGPAMNISAPLNMNPQFQHLVRPEISQHPSNRRPDNSF